MKILALVPWSQNWCRNIANKKIWNEFLSMIRSFLHLVNIKIDVNWCNFSHLIFCYLVSCKGLVNDVETVADRQACNWDVWRHNTSISSKISEPFVRGDSISFFYTRVQNILPQYEFFFGKTIRVFTSSSCVGVLVVAHVLIMFLTLIV